MGQWAVLLRRTNEERLVCNTVVQAIRALDWMGIRQNSVSVTEEGKVCTRVNYEGMFRPRLEDVKLWSHPDSPKFATCFEALLKEIFNPFLLQGRCKDSICSVRANRRESGCFLVNLNLVFPTTAYPAIYSEFEGIADDVAPIRGAYFVLD